MTDNSRVRVSIVGVVIVALFGALFARLWFLQVGADADLQVQVVSRTTRVIQTEMPRGRILDRNGVVLVDNRVAWALTMDRELDEETRTRVLGQLAELLGEPYTREKLESNYSSVRQSPLKPAIIAFDVPESARVVVLERTEEYPGVRVEKVTVREYPNGALAAHALGYVGEISDEQLASRRDDGYEPGDTIGRAGVERAYEGLLRGDPRRETVEVDPRNRPVGPPVSVDEGTIGNDVYLTIDSNVQRVAEASLQQAIESARTLKNSNITDRFETLAAPAGSVVVLDVADGSLVAMASYPSYDPAGFTDGISQPEWDALNDPNGPKPLLNRATQGEYAPGSTFKLVTSVAMTRYGIRSPGQWITDDGAVEIGNREFKNANRQRHGQVDLREALTVSSDVYFYTGGYDFWRRWKAGDVEGGLGLQAVTREFGFGANTGVELDEQDGAVPDPDWKRELSYAINTGDAREENAIWLPGDNVNMSVGQGYMLATPLQLANAYAAFANGGTLWKPHIGMDARDADGEVVDGVEPEAIGQVTIDSATYDAMRAGFRGVVEDGGTAYSAFTGFDAVSVAGKTGTAQVDRKGDTSLFAAYFPAEAPRYVVVAVVEEAGMGAQTAAPIVRRVIESMNGVPALTPVEAIPRGSD